MWLFCELQDLMHTNIDAEDVLLHGEVDNIGVRPAHDHQSSLLRQPGLLVAIVVPDLLEPLLVQHFPTGGLQCRHEDSCGLTIVAVLSNDLHVPQAATAHRESVMMRLLCVDVGRSQVENAAWREAAEEKIRGVDEGIADEDPPREVQPVELPAGRPRRREPTPCPARAGGSAGPSRSSGPRSCGRGRAWRGRSSCRSGAPRSRSPRPRRRRRRRGLRPQCSGWRAWRRGAVGDAHGGDRDPAAARGRAEAAYQNEAWVSGGSRPNRAP